MPPLKDEDANWAKQYVTRYVVRMTPGRSDIDSNIRSPDLISYLWPIPSVAGLRY